MLAILDAGIAAKYVSMMAAEDPEHMAKRPVVGDKAERARQRRKETLGTKNQTNR
jgi:hypothetical protein